MNRLEDAPFDRANDLVDLFAKRRLGSPVLDRKMRVVQSTHVAAVVQVKGLVARDNDLGPLR